MLPVHEPPGADPHAGWCGEGGLEARPYPIMRLQAFKALTCFCKLPTGGNASTYAW